MSGSNKEKMVKWFRLTSRYFVAGVGTENNKIVQTAPILAYMRGWSVQKMYNYAMKKRWSIGL